MDIISESVSPDHGMIDVETAGYRSKRIRVPGAYSLGGDIELTGCPEDIGTAAYFVLGSDIQTNSAGIYRHLMSPSQDIPSFKCEFATDVLHDGVNYGARRCRGGIGNSITFEAVAREALSATWGVTFAQDALGTVSSVAPVFPTGIYRNPLIFHQGAVTFGTYGLEAAVANVEAFRCTIENDIDVDAFIIGSRFLPGMRTQGITVTGDRDVIRKEHMELMKDGAIIGNAGHFNVEIKLEDLENLSKRKREIRKHVEEYTLKNGKKIYLLGKGRIINLVAAEGHPSDVMDMSFSNHALCCEYLVFL